MGKRRNIVSTKAQQGVPSGWPSEITYIKSPRYAPNFPISIRVLLEPNVDPQKMKATALPAPVSDYSPAAIAIRRIESTSHPAHGQRGLFASKTIPPNTFVIQYLGEIHVDDRPTSDYDLSLTKFYIPSAISEESPAPGNDPKTPEQTCVNVGVDASAMGNEARFINDYRGTGAERPNAFFKDVRDKQGVLHMTIWTGKEPISKGKEILVSYGKGWWNARLEQEA